ncbi:ABC1-domain-containing protein [Stereum hirsutum FP-91666 SS1]|uniref:ABC1-domain-containing protein n=1 Tax=Stereum hirsutum (strain FP-91666) TaxID=721885 RepID=UPI0004449CEB|nr:ABC1-domain-containing protein [Stereum hirsutum FP-91666 SS1]EIM82704.1 ABC1-domain-containing protein [Stereum hirsutum FP-91666 SS1]
MQSLSRRCLSWRAPHRHHLTSHISSAAPSSSSTTSFILSDGRSQFRRTFFSRWPSRRAPRHVKKPLEPAELRTKQAKAAGATVTALLLVGGAGWVAYEKYQPFRHTVLAAVRCSRVAEAAVLGAIDYKRTFAQTYADEKEQLQAYSRCHKRSAERVLKALLANGGVFIKLGQHMASLVVLPIEWTATMRPLQDQCEPTPVEDVEALFLSDIGQPLSDIFDSFEPEPIGVASLAQVHVGHHRQSGKTVAVKLQHPHLAEFCEIDMEMVEVTLGWIKRWFPDFEFTWLGEEMRENLPKEMDFVHEARNAERAAKDFEKFRTSLYIPEVIAATKRVLIMEFIQGGRVDDLEYLADHNIDRNKVSLELSRIFSQMVYLNGWFHADPHPGNLLIRPRPEVSKSPYNFEIVLLDHGLYFDLDTPLRINYSKLWLALIAPASPETNADRRKYAELVGNIGPELYPVFEAALTGRATMSDDPNATPDPESAFHRASSVMDLMPQSEEEMEAIRNAVVTREGLLLSVFTILRKVPRRVLMVFKLNDLTRRSLDHALATTHSKVRVFLIMAKYCATAVWRDDRRRVLDSMREQGLFSFHNLGEYISCWWRYEKLYRSLAVLEMFLDTQAWARKTAAWMRGLWRVGFDGAHKAAAGLAYD